MGYALHNIDTQLFIKGCASIFYYPEKAGSEPTRTGLLSALEGLAKEDLGGMTLDFAADDHQGSDQVYITQISAGAAKPVTTLSK